MHDDPNTALSRRGLSAGMPKALNTVSSRGTGTPAKHQERWSKVTVVMLERHVAYLDEVGTHIRKRHRKTLFRAELIRALVEFMEQSRIDFTRFANEREMVQCLVEYFQALTSIGHCSLLLTESSRQVDGSEESQRSDKEEVHQSGAAAHVNA